MSDDAARVAALHIEDVDTTTCRFCDELWPCQLTRLVAALAAAEQARDQYKQRVDWLTDDLGAMRVRVVAAEQARDAALADLSKLTLAQHWCPKSERLAALEAAARAWHASRADEEAHHWSDKDNDLADAVAALDED